MKSLKRFHVQLEFNDDGIGELNTSIPWFINVLNGSKSDNLKLEEIIICFILDFEEEEDDIVEPLCEVADVLLGDRFPRLLSMKLFLNKYGSTRDDILEYLDSSSFAQRMRSREGFVLSFELGGVRFYFTQSHPFPFLIILLAPDREENFLSKSWWLRVGSRDKEFPLDPIALEVRNICYNLVVVVSTTLSGHASQGTGLLPCIMMISVCEQPLCADAGAL